MRARTLCLVALAVSLSAAEASAQLVERWSEFAADTPGNVELGVVVHVLSGRQLVRFGWQDHCGNTATYSGITVFDGATNTMIWNYSLPVSPCEPGHKEIDPGSIVFVDLDGDGFDDLTFIESEYGVGWTRRVFSWDHSSAAVASEPRATTALAQNVPNPFIHSTRIDLDIALRADAEVMVYDVAGRAVRKLVTGKLEAGHHSVIWDGKADSGSLASPGVYFYTLTTGSQTSTKKMIQLR